MTHHLVGTGEIAEMLGVSRQRVDQITRDADDFPEPEVSLRSGRVWTRAAIQTWIAHHPIRPTGRPRRPD